MNFREKKKKSIWIIFVISYNLCYKLQSLLEVLKACKFAAILVNHPYQSSLGLE